MLAGLALAAVPSIAAAITAQEAQIPAYPAGYGVRAYDVAQKIQSGRYKTVQYGTNGDFQPVTVLMGQNQVNIQVVRQMGLTIDDAGYAGIFWGVPFIITSTDGSYPLDITLKRGDVRMVYRDFADTTAYYELPAVRVMQPDSTGQGLAPVITDPVHLNTRPWAVAGSTTGPYVLWLDFDATYEVKQTLDIGLRETLPTYIIIADQYLLPIAPYTLPTPATAPRLYGAMTEILQNVVKTPANTAGRQAPGNLGSWLAR
jgi:hypothetical protein